MKTLKKVCMAVLIAAVFVGVILLGEYLDRAVMSTFLYIVIGVCVLEMRYALGERIPKQLTPLIWVYALGFGTPYFFFGFTGIVMFTLLIFILGVGIAIKFNFSDGALQNFAFVLIYPALLLSSLLYINKSAVVNHQILETEKDLLVYSIRGEALLPYNTVGMALVLVVSSFCDSAAMLGGMAFGKHKLCPEISPNKTIEGAICGIVGGLVGASVVWLMFEYFSLFKSGLPVRQSLEILDYALIGLFGAAFTQLGDLLASQVKRHCGIKDYSHLLGSHGGFMDRFDGIMLNGCFVALIYTFIL